MFTGLIEERGEIVGVEPSGDGARLTVRAPLAVSDARQGDSIAVSGVCLTVVDQGDDWFTADVMRQSLDMSSLGDLAPGSPVNLERALAAHTRLGGHIVQGHVDGTGEVLEVRPGAQWSVVRVSLPADLAPLVVDKGSITVDGVSLTVSAVSAAPSLPTPTPPAADASGGASGRVAPGSGSGDEHWFEVSLIPETLAVTTLGIRRPGDRVNLETDILARHVQRLLAFHQTALTDTATTEGGSR
ncbi:MAG TPA: riboflavin synthase [Microbacterium sp.]|nr:riboflavin synthase [Microbacterium sp.]